MDRAIRMLIMISIQIFVCLAFIAIYHKTLQTHHNSIIVVDLNKIMKDELVKMAQIEMSEHQRAKAINDLSVKLKESFQVLSKNGKNTILIKEVVLNGAQDETPWVRDWLNNENATKNES